jgi:hypothetical protein
MKNEINTTPSYKLFNAFGDIKDEYIESAITEKKRKNVWYLSNSFLGISAACFCIIAVTAAIMIALGPNRLQSLAPVGSSAQPSDSEYNDNIYDTLNYLNVPYTRLNRVTDISLCTSSVGKAETQYTDGQHSFEAYKLKNFSQLRVIAVKFDENTYYRYISNDFSSNLTYLMSEIESADEVRINYVSTAFSEIKKDGAHSELRYTGMTYEKLKWFTYKVFNSDYYNDVIDNSPVLLSFNISLPSLETDNITLTVTENGSISIQGDSEQHGISGYNIGYDTAQALYKYIITNLEGYTYEFDAGSTESTKIIRLPENSTFYCMAEITDISYENNSNNTVLAFTSDYLHDSVVISSDKYHSEDAFKIGDKIRVYKIDNGVHNDGTPNYIIEIAK